jgi:hypothetical protein
MIFNKNMLIFLLIPSFLYSCASTNLKTAVQPDLAIQTFSSEKCQNEKPVNTFPRDKQLWNENLYGILKTISVKETIKTSSGFNTSTIEIYDLLCVLNPPIDNKNETTTSCEYWTFPKSQKSSTKRVIVGKQAEALRIFLYDFPVRQGDSGASTAFIRCEKSDGMNVDCQMAITLNYEGP